MSSKLQLQSTSKALNWIIDSMVDKGMSKGKRPELPDLDVNSLREEGNVQSLKLLERLPGGGGAGVLEM